MTISSVAAVWPIGDSLLGYSLFPHNNHHQTCWHQKIEIVGDASGNHLHAIEERSDKWSCNWIPFNLNSRNCQKVSKYGWSFTWPHPLCACSTLRFMGWLSVNKNSKRNISRKSPVQNAILKVAIVISWQAKPRTHSCRVLRAHKLHYTQCNGSTLPGTHAEVVHVLDYGSLD